MHMVTFVSLVQDPRVKDVAPMERGAALRNVLLGLFQIHNGIQIDLEGATSLTPSFAYEAFGHLYDRLEDDLPKRLTFINDSRAFSDRILDAIDRRKRVLSAQRR